MFDTITAIKAANRAAGLHFFDADSMRFFRSKVESGVIGGRFFVTSEQFVTYDGVADVRRYTVRRADDDGAITTVGEFQQHPTEVGALGAAVAAAKAEWAEAEGERR